jgi:UDP-3-O-[3-hydroxymyristoyl] N-acetylglucosamine deacetylase
MDGMVDRVKLDTLVSRQHTLKSAIGCVGIGLHSGEQVRLMLHPAEPGTGILFRRTDVGVDIPARFDLVSDTRLCTQIGLPDRPEARVGTVEHVMAALAGLGIDNAVVALDGPEVPVLDGSAAPFVFLIDCAGRVAQDAPREMIEILHPVRVGTDEAFAELRPGAAGLDMALCIDFAAPAIGRQALTLSLTEAGFRQRLADARTFALLSEIDSLRAAGLARGGSLDNAVVVDDARVVNPEGLRGADEFVRHKMLDAVGDLALAGAAIQGRFIGHRSGHALNNRLLRALFADRSAWRQAPMEPAWASYRMPAQAA